MSMQKSQHTTRTTRRRGAGLTLVELLIALTITGMIGVATAMMMVSVSYGTTSKQDMRGINQRVTTITHRLNAAVRGSKMVLEAGDDYLVLWTADTRVDEGPNLSEIRLIERDPGTHQLRSYTADFGAMTEAQIEANDTLYATSDDFAAVTDSLKSGSMFPATKWGDHVTEWICDFTAANVQAASLLEYRLTVNVDGSTQTAVQSMALRNH